MDCDEVRKKISVMFENLTPRNVDLTRAEIDPHLKVCAECRAFLNAEYERKKNKGCIYEDVV